MGILADRNTEKYAHWLKLLSETAEKGEYRNLEASLSYLTAAGTVLEDPQVVYVSEFLEYLVDNLRPGLHAKKGRPEQEESARIVQEALSIAMDALKGPMDAERLHHDLTNVRYKATRLQLSKLAELQGRIGPSRFIINDEEV